MQEQTSKFGTERTRHLRATKLSEKDARTISTIEDFGCAVIHVKGEDAGPGWSYTIGVSDIVGKAEVIQNGLQEKTAHFLLNEAARQLRRGVDLQVGHHGEMIGGVEGEFRPVDPRWIKHLMGLACWYYGSADFAVLQAVYPDRENRFSEDPDFDTYFQQPLLQPGAPMTVIEEDFWASADPPSSLFDWKFPDPPHTRVFLSQAVNSGEEEVTYVSHDEDDGSLAVSRRFNVGR